MSEDAQDPHRNLPPLELDFALPDREAWEAAAVASNKDKPIDRLVTATTEGLAIQPLYRSEDVDGLDATGTLPGRPPFARGPSTTGYLLAPWLVAQEIGYATPQMTNAALRHDLARGQTAVRLLLDQPGRAGLDPDDAAQDVGRAGLSVATAGDLRLAFDGIDMAAVPVSLPTGQAALPLLALWLAAAGEASDLSGCLEVDPLGTLAAAGQLPGTLASAYDEMAWIAQWAAENAPNLATVAVRTSPYHDAGADAVQELVWAMATAVAYAEALGERGINFPAFSARLRFEMALDGDFFMTIAKLRAARQLWSQIAEAFGGDETVQRMSLFARTARRNKTLTDPYNNMLRVTTEALSAAAAGVDGLHIAPFDEPAGPPSEFSRRIARNVHLILGDEARLRHLIDPGGGAGAVEVLTAQLAEAAWKAFQVIEGMGSMAAALQQGTIHDALAQTSAVRQEAFARRQHILVGANQFANINETPLPLDAADYDTIANERAAQVAQHRSTRADVTALLGHARQLRRQPDPDAIELVEAAAAAAAAGATLGELAEALRLSEDPLLIDALPAWRLSEPFETLRADALAYAVATGHKPSIFLATMGPLRQHKARAEFSEEFFHAGGFAMTGGESYATPEAAVAAWQLAPTPAVVICSTDDTYPDLVPPLVDQVRAVAPDTLFILAGYPKEQVARHEAAGIDVFIYMGADCLATNTWLMTQYSESVA